jgi:hypothetical protein
MRRHDLIGPFVLPVEIQRLEDAGFKVRFILPQTINPLGVVESYMVLFEEAETPDA